MRRLLEQAVCFGLAPFVPKLESLIAAKERLLREDPKGRRYLERVAALPGALASRLDLNADRVEIGGEGDLSPIELHDLLEILKDLQPWRKGPFRLFGTDIDSEWVSSLKWNRIRYHISPLAGRRVLDIGSSNGYYLYRMAVEKPLLALGVEPYLTYYFQFLLLQNYARVPGIFCLPATFEELPGMWGFFDTVFSMGVLSHRRSPLESLEQVRRVLRPGGELVLETLVMEGEEEIALCPGERYARMNNVYFLPTVPCLRSWLGRAGFDQVRCVDLTLTTPEEQRRTPWAPTESLEDFLDPADPKRTLEGYPAPRRAVLLARSR